MSDKPVKPKKKVKAVTTVNAKELKAWLRGIQEFQPEGWVPSVEQWDAIRERIFLLEEVEVYADAPQQYYTEEPRYAPTPAYSAVPSQAYAAVNAPVSSALGSAPTAPQGGSLGLATSTSPTESGMVPVTSAQNPLEGEYKSPF